MVARALFPLHRIAISRLFGVTVYGAYRIGADLSELAARTATLGADKGLSRFLAEDRIGQEHELEEQTLGTALRLAGGAGAALAMTLALAASALAHLWQIEPAASMLRAMAISLFAWDLAQVLIAATLGAKVMRVNTFVRGLAEPLLLLGAVVGAARAGRSALALGAAHAAVYVTLLALAAVGCATVFGARRLVVSLRAPRRPGFIRYSLPLAAAELSNALLGRLNVFLLGAFSGPDTVALFGAAEELGRPIAAARYVFDPIAATTFAECFKLRDWQRLAHTVGFFTRWVASAAAPLFVTLLVLRADLLALYGPTYAQAGDAMILLAGVHLSNAVLGVSAGLLPLSGRPVLFFLNNLGSSLANLLLCLVLIPRFGLIGAATASLTATLLLLGALVAQGTALVRINPFNRTLLKPLAAALGMTAVELALNALPLPRSARLAVVIAAGLPVYGLLLLALRPDEAERRLIVRVLGAPLRIVRAIRRQAARERDGQP
jgi:O-antigen/teichoic acid export membrane protein